MTVKRIWHGWTAPENAEAYYETLLEHVIPSIEAKNIPGFRGMEVLCRDHEDEDEVEFVTMMAFDSLQSVIDFQGEDYARCYVPDAAQRVLKRWDEYAEHYELKETRVYDRDT